MLIKSFSSQRVTLVAAASTLVGAMLMLNGCSSGPRAFTKGEYDDPTRVELLDDKFNEADMQQMADTVIKAMVACPYVANAPKPPVVALERVANRTQDHIDTVSMTSKIQTALINTRKVRFVNKSEREAIGSEVEYQNSGNVSEVTAKKKGRQIGADYILSGSISTNVQELGNRKLVYYKLTMNLTNLETSTIDCTEEKEIRKAFSKQKYRVN